MEDFVLWMERQEYAELTVKRYTQKLDRLDRWLRDHGRPSIPRCSWRDVRQFADEILPYSYASRQQLRSAIACFWRFSGLGKDEAPTWAVRQPKQPQGHYRGLDTAEDVEKLLAAARTFGGPQYVACCAMYYQALRREEASRMRWDDLRDGRLRGVGKFAIEFSLPVHPKFGEALQLLEPSGSPWILEGRWPGTHVSPATVWSWVRLASERAGLGRTTPHQLRHSSIATVHDATGELRTAMVFARHRDPQATTIYTRTTTERLAKGMAAL